MHSMWKGAISFGLVHVPVKMFAATEDKDIRLRYLHRECKTPIRYEKHCPACGREVEMADIVRGYEYQPNRFIVIEDEELERLAPARTRTIDILDFVHLSQIDPVYFDKTYYLAPEESGFKAYALLRRAMGESERIAMAKVVIRNSTSLAALRVKGRAIIMETIFYPDEIRSADGLSLPEDTFPVSDQETELARTLIDTLATEFEPGKYSNDYRTELMRLIESKAQNEQFVAAPTGQGTVDNVVDLMKALQASIAMSKSGDPNEQPKRPAAKRAKTKKATG